MNRLLTAALIVGLLNSCADLRTRTEERNEAFTRTMNGWVARSSDDLLREKGPPADTTVLADGGRELAYMKRNIVMGATGPVVVSLYDPLVGGRVPQLKTTGISASDRTCKLVFRVSPANIIESWSASGTNCH